ncbi:MULTISPECIES: GspE/PulE family protein [Ramlibacter]|uniref:Type II/IV secretion system protein n=1 Tax=Ramlibacter pinisoli TaxID=2682844 RepID=A0A6N8J0S2_9BURK|nr:MULTISPECIES: GspE/PulE family protein [Ramlibacter]MBA2961844.1 type II/IV secretion system protein [Ramlibacter sp. CGMCC 1.13660]MVQ31786.1 type II/IV secretion system protein [Ramlibacter pinisoli]
MAQDPATFVQALAATLHYPTLASADLRASTPDFSAIPLAKALQRGCSVVRLADGRSAGVFADPFDASLLAWLDARLHGAPLYLVHASELEALLARHEEEFRAVDNMATEPGADLPAGGPVESLSLVRIDEDSSLVVKLVNSTLYDALKVHASDIHLESTESGLAIKFRIDGVLMPASRAAGVDVAEQVISRIKVMAELDIAERRVPQDGRFKVSIKGRQIDFRVSIMPSIFGEDAVLRILDKQDLADSMQGVRLASLGFEAETIRVLRRLAREPYGMVLVTGPTGSGKTTTLYAMISEINNGQDKIVTIEDPVEYQLPGVLQIPVNEKKGLTFARGLRSILRHDPDKIMVGEIRDPETAQIAVQSALTGHLVFTTIHANNVFDVINRFTQMAVDAYSFMSALNGILAQRLLRQVCTSCATPVQPTAAELAESGIDPEVGRSFQFVVGQGCGRCRGTGYRGRTAIAEILLLDDELRQLIIDRQPIARVKEAARRRGLRLLRESALALVAAGRTTLQEINRVTFVD